MSDPVAPTAPPSGVVAPVAKQSNPVGLVAFIAAIVGFVFACIPGALIAGWVLLPIAFVLAIVGLVLAHRRRGFALTALIVSIVGTIVGVVVFFAVVATSFGNAFGGGDVTVAPNGASSTGASSSASDGVGTRHNPAPLGSKIIGADYTVVINSVTPNANDQVLAANQFNEAPPPGSSYMIINATITYTGKDSGSVGFVGIDYVTAAGNVITDADNTAVPPDPALQLQELYSGASVTGNTVLAVPDGDAGLIRIRPGIVADEKFVSTK